MSRDPVRPARPVSPAGVDAQAVGRAVRELQRMGLVTRDMGGGIDGWVSVDYIPLIAQRLGFPKKTVRALRAELAGERHIEGAVLAGIMNGWLSRDAIAFILRGEGHSSDPGYTEKGSAKAGDQRQ